MQLKVLKIKADKMKVILGYILHNGDLKRYAQIYVPTAYYQCLPYPPPVPSLFINLFSIPPVPLFHFSSVPRQPSVNRLHSIHIPEAREFKKVEKGI